LPAGLLAFIPTVGPFVAGIAIVLAGLAGGTSAALGAVAVHAGIQALESYVLTPH